MIGEFIGILDLLSNRLCIGDKVAFSKWERGVDLAYGIIEDVIVKEKTRTVKVKVFNHWREKSFRFLLTETETDRLVKV